MQAAHAKLPAPQPMTRDDINTKALAPLHTGAYTHENKLKSGSDVSIGKDRHILLHACDDASYVSSPSSSSDAAEPFHNHQVDSEPSSAGGMWVCSFSE